MGKDEAVTDVSGRSVGLAGALIDISGEGARSLVSTGVVGAEMTIGVDARSREGTAMFGVLEAAAASMESLFNKRTASVKATNASCRCVARLDAIDATDAEGTSASEAVTSQGQSRWFSRVHLFFSPRDVRYVFGTWQVLNVRWPGLRV